jgi:hypothetical protein
MRSVEDLDVFKLAHELALKIYSITKAFPRQELFSLGEQTRRAAGSPPLILTFREFSKRGSSPPVLKFPNDLNVAKRLNDWNRGRYGGDGTTVPCNRLSWLII